jgi:transcriptional regulator with XRE-family HTH domain
MAYQYRYRERNPSAANAAGAKVLRRARKLLGLGQRELGAALGVKALSVSRWETSRVGVPMAQRKAIVGLLAARDRAAAATLAKDFGVPEVARSGLLGKRDPKVRRAELDGAVLRMAEALDIVPSLAKKTTADIVQRLARLEMSPREVMELLGIDGAISTG